MCPSREKCGKMLSGKCIIRIEGPKEEVITVEDIYNATHRKIGISISTKLLPIIKELRSEIVDDEGRPIPLSNLIEDMLIFVLKDEGRLNEFLCEFYPEDDEYVEKGEKKKEG
jgi:hypothetical protein